MTSASHLYERPLRRFGDVDYFKPSVQQTGELVQVMAPLILHGIDPAIPRTAFGKLTTSEDGIVDTTKPTVYFSSDSLPLNGKFYPRLSYLWCYNVEAGNTNAHRTQGVRVTLDTTGQPLLWEPLVDTSGKRQVFVAQTVESSRTNQPVPAGRRFHVEPPLAAAPDLIVPRILDDGPVPMGPIVYLGAAMRDIHSIICRCMPAQATNIVRNTAYELEDATPVLPVLQRFRPDKARWWPGDPSDDTAAVILGSR